MKTRHLVVIAFWLGLALGWCACGYYIYGGMVGDVVKIADIRESK